GRDKNLSSNRIATTKKLPSLPLPNFKGLQERWKIQNKAQSSDVENEAISSGWGEDEWGVGGGDFKQVEHYQFYRRVWDETDGLLYYPGVLAYHKISGTVNTRLVFHADGTCNWPAVQINSSQPYLRIYVLDLMSKLCRLNLK